MNNKVIHGLHTNSLNFAQSKLVSVLKGKILDVAVDFRVGSPTFGKVIGVKYDDKDLYINWNIKNKDIILGKGDKNLKSFKEVKSPFTYKDNLY